MNCPRRLWIAIVAGTLLVVAFSLLDGLKPSPLVATVDIGSSRYNIDLDAANNSVVVSQRVNRDATSQFNEFRLEAWSLPKLDRLPELGKVDAYGDDFALSPGGRYLAVGDWNGIRILERPAFTEKLHISIRCSTLAFSRDDQWVAIAESGRTTSADVPDELKLWNLTDKREPKSLAVKLVQAVIFSSDSRSLIICHAGSCSILDLQSWEVTPLAPNAIGTTVSQICVQEKGNLVAFHDHRGDVHIWDIRKHQLVARFLAPRFSRDMRRSLCWISKDDVLVIVSEVNEQKPKLQLAYPFFRLDNVFDSVILTWDSRTSTISRRWRAPTRIEDIRSWSGSDYFFTDENWGKFRIWRAH